MNVKAGLIERSLQLVHTVGAMILKTPELALDDDDAKKLGAAFAEVGKLHNVVMTPEQEAYMNLGEAILTIYPPMVLSIYLRKKAEAEAKKPKRPSATVTNLHLRPVADAPGPLDAPKNDRDLQPQVVAEPIPTGLNFDPFAIKLDN